MYGETTGERAPSPRVSVLMPVYNVARYLPEAVESILDQTFGDFEFVIVDDGSTDDSLAILKRYAEQDARIYLIEQENTGATVALSRGLRKCSGFYLARMDADDIAFPERLAKQVTFLDANPDVLACGTGVASIDPLGVPLRVSPEIYCAHDEIFRSLMRGNGQAMMHPTLMARQSALETVGGYDDQYRTAQDLDLFLRLGEVGTLANLPEVLLKYRHHLSSANYAKQRMQVENKRLLLLAAHARQGLSAPPEIEAAESPRKPCEFLRGWGWNALEQGCRVAACKHALGSLRRCPLSWQTWKLLACCLRGY